MVNEKVESGEWEEVVVMAVVMAVVTALSASHPLKNDTVVVC